MRTIENLLKVILLQLLLGCGINIYAYDFVVDNVYYNKLNDNEVEVTYWALSAPSGCSYTGDIVVPSTVLYSGVTYSVVAIGRSAFVNCYDLTSVLLPSSIRTIGKHAFYGAPITSIDIPSSVVSLDECAFLSCTKLQTVSGGNSIKTIGKETFCDCWALSSIYFSESLEEIGKGAFVRCSSLASASFPKNLTYIGENAFADCNNLSSVTTKSPTPLSITQNVFSNRANAILYVPKGSKSAYETAEIWKDFKEIIEFNDESEDENYNLSITATGNGYAIYGETSVREGTNTFTVTEGTSATITFTPDNGYRIKCVKVNNTDVTSSVSNNSYTINSINSDTSVEVVFEAIPPTTYTLSIKATGNGYASISSQISIREGTKIVTVEEGVTIPINIIPDEGYRIKSVMVNNTDVTSSVSNYHYTISNISCDTSVEVEFEAITYLLSITATGNGYAIYDETSVREGTNTFTVAEGTSATITFSPEYGYYLSSLKLNNIDVKAGVSNNQYVVANISENTTLEVAFEERSPIKIDVDGLSYYIYLARKTAEVAGKTNNNTFGSSARLSIPSSIVYDGVTYNVVSIRSNAFSMNNSFGSIEIPNSITRIESSAFKQTALQTIRIPQSVAFIGSDAFRYCSDLRCIKSEIVDPYAISENVFERYNHLYDRKLLVPANTQSAYEGFVGWTKYVDEITETGDIYELKISASGKGCAYYEVRYRDNIYDGTKIFDVVGGEAVVINFTPDNGYRIKSVKVNSSDVTSNVANNQYILSSVDNNTFLEVAFEAIPPTTYTLSITATGNGSVTYNGTSVRGKTSTFTVNEGTSATISFSPDNDYRIKSVKVNDTDVTSSVSNNSYTISNITVDTSVEVEFEAIPPTTYTLSIKATGNGSVTYNGTSVRGKTSTFTVNEGSSATISFSPDSDYRIKSVKVNNTDVTSSVSNNSYTISNITVDTSVEVVFELIPPTTYTLSIKATGNGAVTYNGTSVRGKTSTFTVTEGTSATISFTSDNGNRIKSVKVNNTDVTSSISNNSYTISSITADTSVEVVFEATPTYTLKITSTGNGSATYIRTSVRNETKTFSVEEGESVSIYITSDTGYRIKSVKANGTDVISSKPTSTYYTINNINNNVSVEIEFEVIPPTTYTLSITATGNGSVNYNGSSVREETKTFTVDKGTNIIFTFSQDDFSRVMSVKVNGVDVTSDLSTGYYTISNVSSDTSVIVEFEPLLTQFSLSITATGSGSVNCNGISVKDGTKTFTVNEGTSVKVSITPENGYRIKSVIEDGIDVTANVNNNQYTTNKVTSNKTLNVTFEEIPVVTYALSVTASGSGTVNYLNASVKNQTQTFTVNEGTSVTVTFSPDNGNSVDLVKVNGTDVTSQISGNRYVIESMAGDMNIEVKFVEDVNAMTVEGVNYKVTSQSDKTIVVVGGNYGKVLTVPATITQNGKTWTVKGIENDALKNNSELAAVIWNPDVSFTASVSNSNLLLYVKDTPYAPATIQNVVVNGIASRIVLTDASTGNNFYCPQAFSAMQISYTHNYQMQTGIDEVKGWETIALPFNVQAVSHAAKGAIKPFASWKNGDSEKPFWLYELTGSGFRPASEIKANTPYIISMPNNSQYDSEWLLNGDVTFAGAGVRVEKTDDIQKPSFRDRTFIPCFEAIGAGDGAYALNVRNQYEANNSGMPDGSMFVLNMRTIHPFEAYLTTTNNAPLYAIGIFDDMSTDIQVIEAEKMLMKDTVYDLQGRKVNRSTNKGVYVVNGKKLINR